MDAFMMQYRCEALECTLKLLEKKKLEHSPTHRVVYGEPTECQTGR